MAQQMLFAFVGVYQQHCRHAMCVYTQELLESPHLTLELISLMDMLPKNLDKVTQEREGGKGCFMTKDHDPDWLVWNVSCSIACGVQKRAPLQRISPHTHIFESCWPSPVM